jgi:hypothetical protein
MQGQKQNICFYSNSEKDKWSRAFLEELKKTSWVNEFQFVCVDPAPNRPALPRWLKQVPTLVINGDETPVKTDTEVMNWLYERKLREMPKKQTTINTSAAVISGEPASYIMGEMGGYGDAGYSFIDSDTSTGGNGGNTLPGQFTFLNGQASPGDRQGQMMGSSGAMSQQSAGRTKKEMLMDEQLDLYKQQRDMGMPQVQRRM